MTTIRAINPDITIFNAPFSRFGMFKIGARCTAVKLDNSDVVVISAIPSTPKIQETLKAMGPVRYLVAPDVEHHLSLEAYAKLYPEAKIIGVQGLAEKHPSLKFHKLFGDKKYDGVVIGWESEFETCYFPGHQNKELAILHKKSKTLIEADLVFNLPAFEQYEGSSSSAGIAGMLSPFRKLSATSAAHKHLNWSLVGTDKKSIKQSLAEMEHWDFTTIIPCHGEIIEKNAKEAFKAPFEFYHTKGKDL